MSATHTLSETRRSDRGCSVSRTTFGSHIWGEIFSPDSRAVATGRHVRPSSVSGVRSAGTRLPSTHSPPKARGRHVALGVGI